VSAAKLVDWIALNLVPGLGPLQKRQALERFGDPAEVAHRAPVEALFAEQPGATQTRQRVQEARRVLKSRAEEELRQAEGLGLALITPDHPDYPAAFEFLPDAPVVLYVRGRIAPGVVRIAIVGSRRPTAYGRRVAAGLAGSLAERGAEIVSGGARGIDSCALLGALEAGGSALAVLGSGFLHLYPRENAPLFERIAGAGAVASEFPLDEGPRAWNFPRRNRLISGLSAAVVVVEATLKSGSLGTAHHAIEQGREVLAVPGPVHSEQSQGCHLLIQRGAKLVQCAEDVVTELSPMYRAALREAPAGGHGGGAGDRPATATPAPPMTPDERAALSLLDDVEPRHIDALAESAPFGIARLQAALFGLLVRGQVEEPVAGYYLARPRTRA
jgi:DNA processing protein